MIIPVPNRKILDPIIRAAKRSAVYIRPLDDIIELGAVASDEDRAEICIYSSPIDPVVLVSADRENLAVAMPVRI